MAKEWAPDRRGRRTLPRSRLPKASCRCKYQLYFSLVSLQHGMSLVSRSAARERRMPPTHIHAHKNPQTAQKSGGAPESRDDARPNQAN
ncbi:hypothetical protein VTH06DRAFT_1516 [Thermothelomyces fergusii]